MTNDNDTIFQDFGWAMQEIERLKAENARLAAALYKMGSKIPFPEIRAGNAEAMAYHTGRNDHYCGMPALALVAWLQSLAKQLMAFDSVKAEAANHYSTALRDLLAPTVDLLDEWRFQLQSALNQKTCLVLDAVDLDKLKRELSRLKSLMEWKKGLWKEEA